jgi:hypothetical protein
MTALVPQASVEDTPTDSLEDILRALTTRKVDAKAVQTPSGATNAVEVQETARKALQTLSDRLGTVTVPSTRRALTPQEVNDLADLVKTAKDAKAAVDKAVEVGRNTVFNHMDVQIEEHGGSPDKLDRDKAGYYLVADEIPVESVGVRLTRELAETQPKITADSLHQLYLAGTISRSEYLSLTRPARVINADKLAKFLKQRPDVLGKVKPFVQAGKLTASFHVRPFKKGTDEDDK